MWYLLLFAGVFAFNLIPAFSPPTWMLLSYVSLQYHPPWLALALLGAAAATLGRMVLAKAADKIIRNRFLSEASRKNIDTLKEYLSKKTKLTVGVFLLYALGPLPSNQLFLAYGLTELPLKNVALPFFAGRFLSYTFWIYFVSGTAHAIAARTLQQGKFLSVYFILTQTAILATVYAFTKVDWRYLIQEKKFRWLRRTPLLS